MSDQEIIIEPKKPNLFVRIAVIAGMLIILFFIALAIVKYVPKIISAISPANVSLTSLFNGNGNTAATSTPSNTNSNNTNYSPAPTEPAVTVVATSSAPVATSTKPANTTNYTNNNYTAPKYTSTYVQTYRTYSGPADLAVSLVKVGQVMSNGSFSQTNSIQPGSRVQVQFNVANVGASASGPWSLNAVLPTSISSEKVYNSPIEPSIPSGASYLMTLAFDSYDGNSNIQITLSGSNDANSANNILIVPLTSNGNNNNGCYFSNGYQYCNNNNNTNNGCYYLNGSYVCNNNNSNNNCYWNNGYQYCNGNNSNNGSSDLSVTITNVGTMDRNTGQFYFSNSNNFNRNDKIAVQFAVTNLGGTNSNNWTFNANLPAYSNSNYNSSTQNSIAPGQTMNFTLGFDNPTTGSNNFSVQLNTQGSDSNSGNNYASRTIYVN